MQITLNLPDNLSQGETFNQGDWLREIAIALFQQERISLSRASKIAGMEVMDFQKLLADRGICVLWLLESIYQTVIIPDVVARELAAASNPIIPAILQVGWIQPQPLTNSELVNQLQQERGLDAGEANAIALALELQADDLLIDERLGRQEALRLGLSIIGILGILLVAKQRSLIPQVQPVMDTLISQAGFRVSSQLYQRVLALAEELY